MIDHRRCGWQIEIFNLFFAHPIKMHDQRPQRIAMCGNDHTLAFPHMGHDMVFEIRHHPLLGVFQAFPARRALGERTAPFVHLFVPPLLPRLILVKPGQLPVITLIERLGGNCEQVFLMTTLIHSHFIENENQSLPGPRQLRCKGDIKMNTRRFQFAPRSPGFLLALLGQVNIFPASEKIAAVPLTLAMAHQHQDILFGCHISLPVHDETARLNGIQHLAHCIGASPADFIIFLAGFVSYRLSLESRLAHFAFLASRTSC